MSEWSSTNLESIVASANTGLDAIRRAPIVEENTGIKCLRIQDISQNKPFESWGNSRVTGKDFERAQLKKDDLIMARTCSPGIVYLVKHDMNAVFNNGLAKIRPDTAQVTSLYLYYLFKSPDFIGHIYGISGGTSVQLNMKLGDLLSYELNLPSLPEQRAMADVLSSLDDKIDLLHRQNKTLEAMAETLFRQWFVEEAGADWEEGKLIDLFVLQRGFDLPSQSRVDGPYPIYAASGYSGGHEEYKVKGPGVTTGRSGLLGKVFFVHEDFWPLNTSLYVKEFRCGTPLFTYFTLKSMDLNVFNAGSAVPTLNRNHVHEQAVIIPPKTLILEFEEVVSTLFLKIKQNELQIHTLQQLRDTLLPKLMSGEVRVTP